MRNNKGLILAITIIFVLILVIMSGTVLLIITNHARVTETQIRRVKSVDAAESAALVRAYEELRLGTLNPIPPAAYYNSAYLTLNNGTTIVSLCVGARTVGGNYTCGSESNLLCTGAATAPPQYCVRAKVRYFE
ncbi:hypothetical protein EPN16_07180 [bacterium]|nr:MAG: hypothetical protein EPN16_07180 [bacterium]